MIDAIHKTDGRGRIAGLVWRESRGSSPTQTFDTEPKGNSALVGKVTFARPNRNARTHGHGDSDIDGRVSEPAIDNQGRDSINLFSRSVRTGAESDQSLPGIVFHIYFPDMLAPVCFK